MASIQYHKQPEESKVIYRKTVITETSNNKLNIGNRMREMASTATKLFHHAPNSEGGYHPVQQSSGTRIISSNTPHATTQMHVEEKKKKESMSSCFPSSKREKQHGQNVTFNGTGTGRREEKHGGGGGYLANVEGQVKNFTHKVEGMNKGKNKGQGKGKSKSVGHDSSSDSSSDDDSRSKKK